MNSATLRRTGGIILGGALVVGLVACADTSGDAPAPGAEQARELAIGVQAAPNSLDPAQLHDGQQRYVWGALYDTLIYSDDAGELQPGAATSWEYSDDALTLTLELRDDMTFSDGDPVTSAAVAATLERSRDTAGPQQNNLSALASVDTPDDTTVVLNLSRPDANLLTSLSYGAGAVGDPDTLDDPSTTLDPVASGPYTLNRDRTVDSSSYVLERRDDHWNADAYPYSTITVRVIQDRTALFNALMTGELDAGSVDPTQAKQAEAGGLDLTPVEGTAVASLVLADRAGTIVPALADVRVRQAINYAFDRQGIVDAIMQGAGSPTLQLFNPLSPAYVDALDESYDHDPERGLELMAEAGYADGFDLALPGTIVTTNYQPTISQSLADIGIRVTWDPVPPQNAGTSTDWGAYFNVAQPAAASRVTAYYFQPTGSQNPFRIEDPRLNELLATVSTQIDPEDAAATYREINEFGSEEAWFAPLFALDSTWATRDGVTFLGTSASLPDVRTFGAE